MALTQNVGAVEALINSVQYQFGATSLTLQEGVNYIYLTSNGYQVSQSAVRRTTMQLPLWCCVVVNGKLQGARDLRVFGGVDFSLPHPNKILDNIADGNSFARVKASHVSNGVAYNYKGVWSSGTTYVVGDEVVYGQSYWLCLATNTNSAPTTSNANWQVIGSYSGFQGAWVNTANYAVGAEVTYGGNYWVCVTANVNSAPSTSNANWQIAGPSSLDNIADGSNRFAVAAVDANKKAIIDFNSAHLNQGALSKKNQASLTTDVTGTLPRGNTDASITNAIGTNSELLTSDFPGQVKLINSGAQAGWSQCTATVLKDTNGYNPTTNGWIWYEWFALNTGGMQGQGCQGWGPSLTSASGDLLFANHYFGNGAFEYYNASSQTWTTLGALVTHRANADNAAHTFRMGYYNLGGGSFRVVVYTDEIKTMDWQGSYTAGGAGASWSAPLFGGMRYDAASYVYIKTFKVRSDTNAYEEHHPSLVSARMSKNMVLNGNNANGTGSPAPNAFGWTKPYSGGSCISGGSYNNYYSIEIGGTGGQGVYQVIPVIAGRTYTLIALMYSGTGANAAIWMGATSGNNAFGSSVGSPTSPIGSWGVFYKGVTQKTNTNNSNDLISQSVTNTWEAHATTFTVPSGMSQAMLILRNNGTAGNAFFNGVMVIEGNRLQDYIDHEPNPSFLASSSPLNAQGSMGVLGGAPSTLPYSSTSSSITLNLPAVTFTRADQSQLSIPAYSPTFSNLPTPSHAYYVVAGINVNTGQWFANLASTAFSGNQIVTNGTGVAGDGYFPVFTNTTASTAASGSTGGGSGGSNGPQCPATWQHVRTKERGFIRAAEVEIGMHLPSMNGWVRVLDALKLPSPIWRYTLERDGVRESFDVNDTHAIKLIDGKWLLVRDVRGGERVVSDKGDMIVVGAEYLRDAHYIAFTVEGHEYLLGGALCHNVTTY